MFGNISIILIYQSFLFMKNKLLDYCGKKKPTMLFYKHFLLHLVLWTLYSGQLQEGTSKFKMIFSIIYNLFLRI